MKEAVWCWWSHQAACNEGLDLLFFYGFLFFLIVCWWNTISTLLQKNAHLYSTYRTPSFHPSCAPHSSPTEKPARLYLGDHNFPPMHWLREAWRSHFILKWSSPALPLLFLLSKELERITAFPLMEGTCSISELQTDWQNLTWGDSGGFCDAWLRSHHFSILMWKYF